MPDKFPSPFGEMQEKDYKCFYGVMSAHQINPSVEVF